MLALSSFRTKASGLPDLINYAALIDEGIVLGKDGSLLGGFYFRGDDPTASTASERNYITALINTYLAKFGAGWALWVDASRIASPGYTSPENSYFIDPISALIDAERRASFEKIGMFYETEYALILQYYPPKISTSKFAELIYDDDGLSNQKPADRHLAEFKRRLEELQDGLSDLLHMRRMTTITVGDGEDAYQSDELVNYLHFAMNNKSVALKIPDCPMYLDSWLGYDQLWVGDTPKLGNKFISCVAIDGFPSASHPGILDLLDGLPIKYRWSSRFIFTDQHEAVAALNRYRLKWQQKVRGFVSQIFKIQNSVINEDALAMTKQAVSAISDANSGLVSYGYYTSVVVLMDEDRDVLDEQTRYVQKEIVKKGFSARIESVNALEAWLGSLPGHTYPNVRRPLIHTLNLADMMPTASAWPGLRENPCAFYPPSSPPLMHANSQGNTPFRLNLHVGDVGHLFMGGPTGTGKSTILAMVHTQFRRYRSRKRIDGTTVPASIVAFDKGRSLYTLCKAIGGIHYDIGNDDCDTPALVPLNDIDTESDALWAEEWIASCYELQANIAPTPDQRNAIHKAMNLLRESPKGFRSLTDYVANVQDAQVRQALEHYTIIGPMGHLLDGKQDSLADKTYTVFEIDELMKLGNANAIPVLLYLFRRFEKSLKGQPAMLSLDEAWVMFGHPVFREKLREWLQELRKKNCLVIMATPTLSAAVKSGILDIVLESCQTKIFLPNVEADLKGTENIPGPADFYKMFGLNDKEINILKNARYKRQYYYKSPLGRRLFELNLGPLALSFVGVSDKEELAQVQHFIREFGDNWPLHWLNHKGVDYEQYLSKAA